MSKDTYIDDGYVDLDVEEFFDANGERITNARAQELADDLERSGPGRPSLTESGVHSPHLSLRVPVEVRHQLDQLAEKEGRRPSAIARDALIEYLQRHAS